ncbi:MAG: hypothetical protein ACLUI3_16765 [Christensenellales bacterium]
MNKTVRRDICMGAAFCPAVRPASHRAVMIPRWRGKTLLEPMQLSKDIARWPVRRRLG